MSKATTPTYAQAVKNPYALKPAVQPPPSIGHRGILVKLNETDAEKPSQRATTQELKERTNSILKTNQNTEIKKTQIIAVKRHPSGDVTLYTTDRESTEGLLAHKDDWQKVLGEKAEVRVSTYGILVHGVSTQMETQDSLKIEEKIQWDNPSLKEARVTYSGWLKRNLGEKRASTMVVEFDREEDADYAILSDIVFGAQIFACEYYDRACKARQCFRCRKYGHIGTHCKAQEICGYCTKRHSTKECMEREKPGSQPRCPNCRKDHPSWSIQCESKRGEFARNRGEEEEYAKNPQRGCSEMGQRHRKTNLHERNPQGSTPERG